MTIQNILITFNNLVNHIGSKREEKEKEQQRKEKEREKVRLEQEKKDLIASQRRQVYYVRDLNICLEVKNHALACQINIPPLIDFFG